ncbi:MAG TPA: alkaline phosphatase family protein [Bryobacteraceae bacterium]|nr:alkaline phosphatase family protein [Bryobacteraceae bacterium]
MKHIVVLMMENRSFDHMLGALKAQNRLINGLTGNETNPDTKNEPVKVQAQAEFQSQLDPDPDHHFPAVNKQLFFGTPGPPAAPAMQGFVQSYFDQQKDVNHSHRIMYYFTPDKLPVLTTLAMNFAVFNGWFASIPGPTICNRAFAHYGTSFGSVTMNPFEVKPPFQSIYDRMLAAGHTVKLYYFDVASSTMEVVNLLSNQPALFGTYDQFLSDCDNGDLPEYSFIEPNYTDHEGDGGAELLASDQHPDHDVQSGELFIATIYNKIRQNPDLWKSTALLIVYDEHGGIFDHVPPPACVADTPFVAPASDTGGAPFAFDRLGVRVPAILISPWIAKGTVVPGTEDPVKGRVFEHASIPATVTKQFNLPADPRSAREKAAQTFLDLLGDTMRPDSDCPVFQES